MTIYVVDLESIPTRYTCEWKTHIPKLLTCSGCHVKVIDGNTTQTSTTQGMFLDFVATNAYKAAQIKKISRQFSLGKVEHGDYFLFTDAWHPGVINLKYMADLFGIKIKIGGLFHAGSWDPQDALGRIIGNQPWIRHAERSFFECFDNNFFASDYHIDLFYKTMLFRDAPTLTELIESKKIVRTGWPLEYMKDAILSIQGPKKQDNIVFPHRISSEKQLEIFNDLKNLLPEYNFITCQTQSLQKRQYHTILSNAKLVFSASLQETLGIAMGAEAPLARAVPLAPDRLSYSELFLNHREFLYPSEWTTSWEAYCQHRAELAAKIRFIMNNYYNLIPVINDYIENQYPKYFHADSLLSVIWPKECFLNEK